MDDEDNAYELERQKIIAENRALLDSLGLEANGSAKLNIARNATKDGSKSVSKKRKTAPMKKEEDSGPRRRSGRLLGLEAEGEELKAKLEEEEKEREVLRVVSRRTRDRVMELKRMVEDTPVESIPDLEKYLGSVAELSNPRMYPSMSTSSKEAYADSDTVPAEVQRLKAAFKDMTLQANAKVTTDRVYTMVVHPEKTKTLIMVGDKQGMLGIWDALGPPAEKVKEEVDDDTTGAEEGETNPQGRIWRVQAHAKNSITSMKIDPINGSGLYSTAYDCTLRHLDFATLKSQELFSFEDDNMLITHFDVTPDGQGAWLVDKEGGISHCDFREGGERRRWVVQEEGRAAKLGGLSVNPLMPHFLVTAGNDQHLRIWDSRHLSKMDPTPAKLLTPPPSAKTEDGTSTLLANTHPTSNTPYETVEHYMESAKGKGLLRASFQHGKSCSAAYWDPWGRRILTTSYDDKLRVWTLNPQSLMLDTKLPSSHFQPSKVISHNCQTGRWLTILRAQWSLNMDYMPHFTVGNMKRYLDVVAANGEKIVSLWADGVTAVPAVTTSHPAHVDHVVGGNTSGRIQLWTAGG